MDLIRELPEETMGQTHIRLWRVTEQVGGWARIRGYLGTVEDGTFRRAEGLKTVEATFVGETYDGVRQMAEEAGAPSAEMRKRDFWRYYLENPEKVGVEWV